MLRRLPHQPQPQPHLCPQRQPHLCLEAVSLTNQARMTSYLAPGALYKGQTVQQPLIKWFHPVAPKAG